MNDIITRKLIDPYDYYHENQPLYLKISNFLKKRNKIRFLYNDWVYRLVRLKKSI